MNDEHSSSHNANYIANHVKTFHDYDVAWNLYKIHGPDKQMPYLAFENSSEIKGIEFLDWN